MNDERIESKLSIIKKNITIVWAIIAFLFILIKLLLLQHIPSLIEAGAEYIVLILSAVALIYHLLVGVFTETPDERTQKRIYQFYHFIFPLTIYLSIGMYFYQILMYGQPMIGQIPLNSFINLFFSLTFLFYYIFARKQQIYFNYKTIELETKVYKQSVLKKGGSILLIGLGLCMISFGASNLGIIPQQTLITYIIIMVSCIIILLEFLFLAIYERHHYTEAINHENGQTILVSRNVLLFMIIIGLFSLFSSIFNSHHFIVMVNYNDYSHATRSIYDLISLFIFIGQFDIFVIKLITSIIIYRSLVRSLPESRLKIKQIITLSIILPSITLFQIMYSFGIMPILLNNAPVEMIQTFALATNLFNYVITIVSMLVPLLYYSYFNHYKYSFSTLFLVLLIMLVLKLIMPLVFPAYYNQYLNLVMTYILSISSFIITIILWYQVTHKIIIKEPLSLEEAI